MILTDLKFCPFCGGDAAFATVKYAPETVRAQEWGQAEFHYVNCVTCGSCNRGLIGYRDQESAAKHWNARSTQTRAVLVCSCGANWDKRHLDSPYIPYHRAQGHSMTEK